PTGLAAWLVHATTGAHVARFTLGAGSARLRAATHATRGWRLAAARLHVGLPHAFLVLVVVRHGRDLPNQPVQVIPERGLIPDRCISHAESAGGFRGGCPTVILAPMTQSPAIHDRTFMEVAKTEARAGRAEGGIPIGAALVVD